METEQSIYTEIQAVQAVFRKVQPILLARAGQVNYQTKGDGSPVTNTDVEIEATILHSLAGLFPGLAVLGEESGYDESDLPERCWLVDPIDGTESFIDNVPAFTNMAVCIEAGETIACVIYNPSTDEIYTAQKGRGAFMNGTRMNLKSLPLPEVAYCKDRFSTALERVLTDQNIQCQKGPQGAGYGFSVVAAGRIAARFNMKGGGYVHDYAPGALLVREAGGVIVPIAEDTYTYATKSFVACHPALETTIRHHLPELRELEAS